MMQLVQRESERENYIRKFFAEPTNLNRAQTSVMYRCFYLLLLQKSHF